MYRTYKLSDFSQQNKITIVSAANNNQGATDVPMGNVLSAAEMKKSQQLVSNSKNQSQGHEHAQGAPSDRQKLDSSMYRSQNIQSSSNEADSGSIGNPEPSFHVRRQDSYRSQVSSEENSTLFSEFKLKYDELKNNYDTLRQQFDEVTRQNKKMQIKILNHNPEYYEKEIKRLKGQLEKYQQQNEDNKYKYLKAENSKKQFQASLKVKQEELSNILKQLQKQKIANVELKHQNEQKQRVFNRIRIQFDKSSETNSKSYDQLMSKCSKLDGALKARNMEYDNLKGNYDRLDRRYTELKDEYKKYKEVNEQKVKNLTRSLQNKTAEALKQRNEASQRISHLSQQIQKHKSERISAELLKSRKSEQVSAAKQSRQLELQVVRLEDRVRDLEYELIKKDDMIIDMQRIINKIKVQEEINELEERVRELTQEKMELLREHERTKGQLIREIERLKIDLMNTPEQIYRAPVQNAVNFQQILRVQLEENTRLKKQLGLKIDEIYNIRSDIDELRVEKQNILSEMEVLKKVKKAEQKNVKIESDIATQHLKNDIDAYRRKLEVMENKYNLKVKEVKEKDNFIMTSLLGRSKPEEAPIVLAEFQRIFEANYVEKLAEANKRIEDLQHKK